MQFGIRKEQIWGFIWVEKSEEDIIIIIIY